MQSAISNQQSAISNQQSAISNQQSAIKHIILASDYKFSEHIITTIKSISYHNKNIQFYLINRDFPSEWFYYLNKKLSILNSNIIDIKLFNQNTKNYYTYTGSEATYFRFFISELINEDKVLYLDCDLVVTGNLDSLFLHEFNDNYVVGVRDLLSDYIRGSNGDIFNAGVMLINNYLWKKDNITKKAIDYANEHINECPDGDQSVLNILFKNRWKPISNYYNYLTGANMSFELNNLEDLYNELNNINNLLPLIIHYNTQHKPWLATDMKIKYRDQYWFYRNLDWYDIYQYQS
ncbi:glycosyltransferase family 8 protein [Mannheimia indoligenes]|uniref:glycosyltransferase family 8 protein n=1 Tax=Mannheimia indoligenes TaxID=3103145 RepID=UPI002FE57571